MKADDLTPDQLLEAFGVAILCLEKMRQGLKGPFRELMDPLLELLRAVQHRLYELENGGPPDTGFN